MDAPGKEESSTGEPEPAASEREGISALELAQSTIAAAFGVQSKKNRTRDFRHGRASQFILAGVVFTALFAGAVVLVVNLVLAGAA